MLANLISDAVRLAPRFANEDGELLFDHLTTKFPDAATDAVDLVVRRVCANATAGLSRDCWASLATSLLNEIEDCWCKNQIVSRADFDDDISPDKEPCRPPSRRSRAPPTRGRPRAKPIMSLTNLY